ncbi:hypothetical protein MMC30_002618 [Trapelia coarctata]|nr:hypothetical protein [Trapelia coarctata]
MSGNGALSRVHRAVRLSGKSSSESMTAMAEFGSDKSQPLDSDWTRRSDSPMLDHKGFSRAVLLEAVGGKVGKNPRLAAASDLVEDLDNLLLADNPWVPSDLMRTNDPLDRDPRFYVRRRWASEQLTPIGLKADVVKMVGCIELVELGGIGPPENRRIARQAKVILFALMVTAAVIVLATLDPSKLAMSSEITYAVILLLVAILVVKYRGCNE